MTRSACVITFPSTYQVLKAEKALKGKMEFKLIPVPRQLSSDCGLSLLYPCPREQEVRDLLSAAGVTVEGWHILASRSPRLSSGA